MKWLVFILLFVISLPSDSQVSYQPPTQWNVVTLKAYMDQKFESMQLAITKAEQATEKRFEGVNEFRNTLADQQRTFIPRAEYESGHAGLHVEVLDLKTRLDKIENMKQGGSVVWSWLLGGLALIISILNIKDKIIKK